MMHQAPCTKCGGNLEFEAESIGSTAICPHCGDETLLTGPRPPAKGKLTVGIVVTVLAVGVVATTILTRHDRTERSSAGQTRAPVASSQRSLQENPASSTTVASNSEHRLLQPISGAFGYTLGGKLPEGLSIAPAQTFTSDTTNYMPFDNITVCCLNDRRVCTITGTAEDDNHAVVAQDLEKKYGQGNPIKDYDGKISAIKWNDGNREIELSWLEKLSTWLSYRDIALQKTAEQQLELSIEHTIPRLFQPAIGTLGWKLGERLPDELPLDPSVHVYFDRTTNFWPFGLTAWCLSDRRIWRIDASDTSYMGSVLSTNSHHKFIEDYLEKQCGQGAPFRDTNGAISETRWSDGRREISYSYTSITYRDIALGKEKTEEYERSEREAMRRLLQPITGAFGYTLGEKLRSALPIDPELLCYTDNSLNFPFIEEVFVDCLSDRRISSITGKIDSTQFDSVKKVFEKKYGLGTPNSFGGEMWSDGKHQIILTPSLIICSDTTLYDQWKKERAEQKSIYRLLQPITGAFGYTLGEKLPEGRFIDPESHAYAPGPADSMTNYLSFFPISVDCLSDRRICSITGTVLHDQIAVVRSALVKKYGSGRFETDGVETWGDAERAILFKPPILIYEDEPLYDQLKKEREHEKEERTKASVRGL
ncbi:MAG: hypothetical protein ACLQU4_16400 [Limisphaerales bacterium]|jgi:hypothetical protein